MNTSYSSYQISPAGIRTSAALYGITSNALEEAQVLELGCGNGINIIRYASAWPLSTSVGIDINIDKINQGQQIITEYGLENVHLFCIDLPDLLAIDPGKFDYIIIHDFFAQLDEHQRSVLLGFCARQLAPGGIIAIKWNTLPGARITDTLRDAIALHTQSAVSNAQKITSARAMLAYMDTATVDDELKDRIQEALDLSDDELALRYIFAPNDACYLTDLNKLIETNQLNYVGDLVPQYEAAEYYGKSIALVHSIATEIKNKIDTQQYLDFAVDRQSRFSLIISSQHPVSPSRLPQAEKLSEMFWAGNFQRRDADNAYYNRLGEVVSSDNELLQRILDVIGNSWPLSISTSQIIQNTFSPEDSDAHSENIISTLYALYMKNIPGLYLSLDPSPYHHAIHNKLKLIYNALPAAFLQQGEIDVQNWWGERALLTKVEFDFIAAGMNIDTMDDYHLAMGIINKGLVTGSDIAWSRFCQQTIASGNSEVLYRQVTRLMLFATPQKQGGFRKTYAGNKHQTKKEGSQPDNRLIEKAKELFLSDRIEDSYTLIKTLLAAHPFSDDVVNTANVIYLLSGNADEVIKCCAQGLGFDDQNYDFYKNLALALSQKNNISLAQKIARYLLRLNPGKAEIWDVLSLVYRELSNGFKYEYCARKAVKLNGSNPAYLLRLGNVLSERNQMREARTYFEKSLQLYESSVNYLSVYSNLLFVILHDSALSADQIRQEHEAFGQKVVQWAKNKKHQLPPRKSTRCSSRLRIGFVSGDFRDHPVVNFIYPIWEALNRDKFELVAYSVSPENDNHTKLLKLLATDWREVQTLSYTELAALIREDEIDILIDLSGHTGHNRLPTFGLKPAPVQMSWIGYPGTTGMKEMDYYIIDSNFAPPGVLDAHFTEKLAYLPAVKPFEPSPLSPNVNALPALNNEYLTFGSFNRPQKITPEVLDCWARILVQLPSSRLLLAYMSDAEMIADFTQELMVRGVKEEQIVPAMKSPFVQYLQMHNEVDVILDTFPYTGGTTTSHAAWMGVPSLTLAGDHVVSRQGGALMNFLELNTFVTHSNEEYVARAVALNDEYEFLNSVRLGLRKRITSKAQRVDNAACYFEKVLEKAWSVYEQGLPAQPIIIEQE